MGIQIRGRDRKRGIFGFRIGEGVVEKGQISSGPLSFFYWNNPY